MISVEDKLAAMGLNLPTEIPPAGNYLRHYQVGNLLFLSGHLPDSDGTPRYMGRLGQDLTTAEGYQAARAATLNALGTVRNAIGDFSRIRHFVKLLGMVNSAPDFIEQPQVMNGASDLLTELFGPEIAPHARSAVGMAVLPRGNSVEIEMILDIA